MAAAVGSNVRWAEVGLRTCRHCAMLSTFLALVLALRVPGPARAVGYDDSIFSASQYYPTVWWAVATTDVPTLASNALILRQNENIPVDFAQNIVSGIANTQRNEVAKALGYATTSQKTRGCAALTRASRYLLNANSTLGGGCPVPPPPVPDLERLGSVLSTAIAFADDPLSLWGTTNLTAVAAQFKSPNITSASLEVAATVSSRDPDPLRAHSG